MVGHHLDGVRQDSVLRVLVLLDQLKLNPLVLCVKTSRTLS